MWLFDFFLKKQTAAALNSRIALTFKSSCKRQKEGTITTYCEIVNYLLETYAIVNVNSETDGEIMRFAQLLKKTAME